MEDVVGPLPEFPALLAVIVQDAQFHAVGTLGPQSHIRTALPVGGDPERIPPRRVRHTPTLVPVLLATLLWSKGASWVNSSRSSVQVG